MYQTNCMVIALLFPIILEYLLLGQWCNGFLQYQCTLCLSKVLVFDEFSNLVHCNRPRIHTTYFSAAWTHYVRLSEDRFSSTHCPASMQSLDRSFTAHTHAPPTFGLAVGGWTRCELLAIVEPGHMNSSGWLLTCLFVFVTVLLVLLLRYSASFPPSHTHFNTECMVALEHSQHESETKLPHTWVHDMQ